MFSTIEIGVKSVVLVYVTIVQKAHNVGKTGIGISFGALVNGAFKFMVPSTKAARTWRRRRLARHLTQVNGLVYV